MPAPKQLHPTIGVCAFTAPGAALCYQELIRYSDEVNGLLNNPKVIMIHPNFANIHQAVMQMQWQEAAKIMVEVFHELADAGAELGIVPINSVHYAIDQVIEQSSIPVLSILDVVAEYIKQQGYQRVLVMGTEITMQGLYVKPLREVGVECLHPKSSDQQEINTLIFEHLLPHHQLDVAQQKLLQIIEPYKVQCDAIVLACTELPMVLNTEQCKMPAIDTTRLLARAAIDYFCDAKNNA